MADDTLDGIALFDSINGDIRQRLISAVHPRRFQRGELLYAQGDTSNDLLLLMSGAVVLYRSMPVDRRAVLDAVLPPGVLGEEALAGSASRATSAEALKDSFVLALPGPDLTDLMCSQPAIAEAARRWLAHQLATLTERRADDLLLDLPGRVAKTLVGLAADGRAQATIALSQRTLADLAGGSRQSVNRILNGFVKRGWLQVDAGQIVLLNVDAIRHRAGLSG